MTMSDIAQAERLLAEAAASRWTHTQVKAYWDARDGSRYGEGMTTWVPHYKEAHQRLLRTLLAFLPANGRLLDLGAGNGRVARLVLEAHRTCHVTLIDLPNGMLKAAPAVLSEFSGRFDLCAGDMFSAAPVLTPSSFDAVISVFALSHAPTVAAYLRVYQDIYACLKPGGLFVCYDHVLGDAPVLTALNVAGWHEFLLGAQSSQQAHDVVVSTYQEDRPLALRQHVELLWQSDFRAVDVLFKHDIFAIYAGVK